SKAREILEGIGGALGTAVPKGVRQIEIVADGGEAPPPMTFEPRAAEVSEADAGTAVGAAIGAAAEPVEIDVEIEGDEGIEVEVEADDAAFSGAGAAHPSSHGEAPPVEVEIPIDAEVGSAEVEIPIEAEAGS